MDKMLFAAVLRNLLHINVSVDALDDKALRAFEDKYCYHPALQPMFRSETMKRLSEQIETGVLYEFRDRLGICALFFIMEGSPVSVGPFVRREFDMEKTRRVMLSAGLPGSYAESLQLYYSNFPLCGMSRAIDAVLACYKAFCPDGAELALSRIDDYPETRRLPKLAYEESIDYSSIYRRYELENQFLQAIEKGDVENVLPAYGRMQLGSISTNRYVNAVYQDANIGLSMVRALARKAAENGGASVVEVNEITQRAVQHMINEQSVPKKVQISRDMFVELAEAVDRARSRAGSYSPPIRRAVETLRHNYSQELDLSWLAEHVGISLSHLSHSFSREVGMSIMQYVASLRCEEAASLLRTGDESVQEIAAYVGYTDNNYFVKVFKKQYGMTPSEYRKAQGK